MEHRDSVKKRLVCSRSCKIDMQRVCKAQSLHHHTYKVKERSEDDEHPDHTEDIEDGMGTGSSLCGGITYCSSHVGCDCGTDVLTKDHGTSQLEIYET